MSIRKIFIPVIALVAAVFSANAEGMEFVEHGTTLAQALEKAKVENKKVFLDCYTSWCGPCKMLSTKIFPLKEVGEFMNPQFVCIKVDMEDGEGPELAKKLDVSAYPTMIMFNADGSEINRMVGAARSGEDFIGMVKKALATEGESLAARFAKGDRDRDFLLAYLDECSKNYRRKTAQEIAEILVENNVANLASDSVLVQVFMKNINNPYNQAFVYTVEHPEAMEAVVGKDALKAKLANGFQQHAYTFLKKNEPLDEPALNAYIGYLKNSLHQTDADKYGYMTKMGYHKSAGNWAELVKTMAEFENQSDLDGESDMVMTQNAYAIAQKCEDKNVRAACKAILDKRIAEIESGKRTAMTLKQYGPDQQPIVMLKKTAEELAK